MKEFGVKLTVKAEVGDDDKSIDLDVTPEVSSSISLTRSSSATSCCPPCGRGARIACST